MAFTFIPPPIAVGLPYSTLIDVTGDDGDVFPPESALRGHLRDFPESQALVADLAYGSGLTRLSGRTVRLDLTDLQTGRLTNTTAFLDLVRTDFNPDRYTYVQIIFDVITPATRGYA